MNANNYIDKTREEFIDIFEQRKTGYVGPQTGHQGSDFRQKNSALIASDIDPELCIEIPTYTERQPAKLVQSLGHLPQEKQPDYNSGLVYRTSEPLIWDRGMNLVSGEGIKEELGLGLDLFRCEFNASATFRYIRMKGVLKVSSCTVANEFKIENSNFKRVHISDLSSKPQAQAEPQSLKRLVLKEVTTEELHLVGCFIDEVFITNKIGSIKKIVVDGGTIGQLILRGEEVEELEVLGVNIQHELHIDTKIRRFELVGNSRLNFENPYEHSIYKLKWSMHNQANKGTFLIRDAKIHKLDIWGSNNSSILFKDCLVTALEVSDFTNSGEFSLHNINNLYSVKIENSSMGKAEFLDVALRECKSTKLLRSNLMDIILIDSTFSEQIIAKDEKDFRGIRDAYRQLKYSAGKQGNRIQELRYEALEMKAYQQENTSSKSLTDQFILWSNSWSNNHGQDPLVAVENLFLITIIPFAFIKLCQQQQFDMNGVLATANQYLNFTLNPLHDFEKVFGKEEINKAHLIWGDFAKALDTAVRLLSGYLIFQFLRAFRKFVK